MTSLHGTYLPISDVINHHQVGILYSTSMFVIYVFIFIYSYILFVYFTSYVVYYFNIFLIFIHHTSLHILGTSYIPGETASEVGSTVTTLPSYNPMLHSHAIFPCYIPVLYSYAHAIVYSYFRDVLYSWGNGLGSGLHCHHPLILYSHAIFLSNIPMLHSRPIFSSSYIHILYSHILYAHAIVYSYTRDVLYSRGNGLGSGLHCHHPPILYSHAIFLSYIPILNSHPIFPSSFIHLPMLSSIYLCL